MAVNFLKFNGVVLSVVGDVPVDSEALIVISSMSRISYIYSYGVYGCVVIVWVLWCI